MRTRFFSCLVVATLLAACTQQNGMPNSGVMSGGGVNKQDIGTVAGAVGGGVLGSTIGGGRGRIATTIIGGLLGGAIGNSIGSSLDNADRAAASQAAQSAFETAPTGRQVAWKNPDSGNSGYITPTRTYQSGGQYCREFSQTIKVGGESQKGYGTACRQPDGSWQIVSQQ